MLIAGDGSVPAKQGCLVPDGCETDILHKKIRVDKSQHVHAKADASAVHKKHHGQSCYNHLHTLQVKACLTVVALHWKLQHYDTQQGLYSPCLCRVSSNIEVGIGCSFAWWLSLCA